jgi:DNA (cytosine-5)-methyltransferase 1
MALVSQIRSRVWGWQDYADAIRVSDGVPNRMDRLRALGNAVVPQIPELIGRAILRSMVTA